MSTSDSPTIRLRNIERWYGPETGPRTYVLRQISLDVRLGEYVTVMGPSGAGKTSLLSILGMLDHDWTGEYWLAGEPVHALRPTERMGLSRRHVGFVFQQHHLLGDLTVAENLDAPLSYRDVPRGEREALVADALDRFGIVAKKDLFPCQLSGGQQQLVGVARAVIASPNLILADEPTGSLHTRQGREVMDLLRQLNDEGTTIIQVTHNEDWAAYGDRIVELEDGWIVGDHTRERPQATPVTRAPSSNPSVARPGGGAVGGLLAGALALAAGLAPLGAEAQQTWPPAADTLRLEAAVEMALGASPELHQAEARAMAAGAGRWDAWGRLLPSVTAAAGLSESGTLQRTTEDPITGGIVMLPDSVIRLHETYQTSARLSLSWTVLDGGQRYWQLRRSREEADAGQLAVEAARARVAAGVTLAYLDVLEAEAYLQVRAAELERANALAHVAQARFDVGEVPELDVLQALLAASEADLALQEAEEVVEAGRLALSEYLGPAQDPYVVLATPAQPHPDHAVPEDELRRCVMEASADLGTLRARAEAARMDAASAGWSFLPSVAVGVDWRRTEYGTSRRALTLDPRNERTDFYLAMSWGPLSQPGRWLGDRVRAQASAAEAQAALAARRPALVREIELALGRIRRAGMLEERGLLNLELAARQREQAEERYRLGVASITEIIQAEALARDAERQAVVARFARQRAFAELEQAAAIRLDDPRFTCGANAHDG